MKTLRVCLTTILSCIILSSYGARYTCIEVGTLALEYEVGGDHTLFVGTHEAGRLVFDDENDVTIELTDELHAKIETAKANEEVENSEILPFDDFEKPNVDTYKSQFVCFVLKFLQDTESDKTLIGNEQFAQVFVNHFHM